MSQDSDVDQVAVVDSSPANTAEAVVEVTPEPEQHRPRK